MRNVAPRMTNENPEGISANSTTGTYAKSRIRPIMSAIPPLYHVFIEDDGLNRVLRGKC
jgi:hypothetical protein